MTCILIVSMRMVIIRGDNLHLLFYFHLILSSPSSSFKSCIFIILISGFLCVCPVIDHEFRHNIVKVAVDPRGDSRVDPQTTLTML